MGNKRIRFYKFSFFYFSRAELFYLTVQRSFADAEHFGRFLAVSAGDLEGFGDEQRFEFRERLAHEVVESVLPPCPGAVLAVRRRREFGRQIVEVQDAVEGDP